VTILVRRGELEAAGNTLDEALRAGKPLPEEVRAGLLALVERRAEAREVLADLEDRYNAGARFNYFFGFVAAFRLGELERACEWLDRAVAIRQSHPMLYGIEFVSIRDHPGFEAALEKINGYTIRYQ
jgi:tetratricopeptide (TPR) repeat protein